MDPFDAALDALLNSPGSVAALYRASGEGVGVPIRSIRGQPDTDVNFGSSRIIEGTNTFVLRCADFGADPAAGDTLQIGDEVLELLGEPMLDVEGISWTMGGSPLPPD